MTQEKKSYILSNTELPPWVKYPKGFIALVESDSVRFPPWELLDGKEALTIAQLLKDRYEREFFPIAWSQGTDDCACLIQGDGGKVRIVNGHTSKGREIVSEYDSFWQWFRFVIDEMADLNED